MISKTIFVENGLKEKIKIVKDEIDFQQSTADALRRDGNILKTHCWQDFRWNLNIFCNVSFRIFFLCCGILQFFAITAGFGRFLPNHNIITAIVSLPLAFLPFVGSAFGIWGAHSAWGWYLSHALIVFSIPYFIVITPMNIVTIIELYKDAKRLRAEKKLLEKIPA